MAKENVNRTELWVLLIEAETNERYFGLVTDVCRWFDMLVKFVLMAAATSSLAAVLAESRHQTWLSWLAFFAATIEVFIRPILDWPSIGVRAEGWRKKWIDIREGFDSLWRSNFTQSTSGEVDVSKLLKKIIAIEKEDGYVPKFQWLIDKISATAAERRRVLG